MESSKKLLILSVLVACSSLLPLSVCFAGSEAQENAPKILYLTETEYNKLVNNLNELAKINERHKKSLTTSQEQLQISQQELQELKTQCDKLNSLTLTLQTKVTEQEDLLQSANQSLQAYAVEEKRTRLRIKRQRNIAYALAGCALYAAIKD